jgi:hypothetical protein
MVNVMARVGKARENVLQKQRGGREPELELK